MRLVRILFLVLINFSCNHKSEVPNRCNFLTELPNLKTLNHVGVTVKTTNISINIHLIQDGVQDTLLEPCTWPSEFAENNLHMFVSGIVKSDNIADSACCTFYIVPTDISKQ